MARTEQRQRTVTVVSAVVTLIALAAFVTFDGGPTGTWVRQLFGDDGRINPAVEEEGTPGGHFRFVATQRGSDEPVGWSPCQEIHFVINSEGAPPEYERLVRDGIEELSDRTGLAFVDDGSSDDRSFQDRIDAAGNALPVLIGWADEAEVPELADDVAGLGGATAVERAGLRAYVTGMVVLDTDTFDDLVSTEAAESVQLALLLHELGHLVGLDHVADRGEIMYGEGVTRTSYGTGDRRGLAQLGAIPCR